MPTIFTSPAGKKALEAHYDRFHAHVPDAKGRWVRTRFGETHVLVGGPVGAPPLLLLHGALSGSAHIMSAARSFLDRFRVYAPDMPGQSVKSIDARVPYDGPAVGQWLADVLDAVGVERAHVYGVSLGGFMARKLAEYAPERIDRLVLNVPAGIVTSSASSILARFILPKLIYRAFPTEERLRRITGAMMTTGDEDWTAYFGEAFRSFRLDLRMPPLATPEMLARFTRPTLVLGAADDIFFPGAELVARAKVLFPHAETELLEGCRHVLPMDAASTARHQATVERFLAGPAIAAPQAA